MYGVLHYVLSRVFEAVWILLWVVLWRWGELVQPSLKHGDGGVTSCLAKGGPHGLLHNLSGVPGGCNADREEKRGRSCRKVSELESVPS